MASAGGVKKKKAASGWTVFCGELRELLKAEPRKYSNEEVLKECGERWKKLSAEEKKARLFSRGRGASGFAHCLSQRRTFKASAVPELCRAKRLRQRQSTVHSFGYLFCICDNSCCSCVFSRCAMFRPLTFYVISRSECLIDYTAE